MRCCPVAVDSLNCTYRWAWESCPAEQGCGSSSSGASSLEYGDAAPVAVIDAAIPPRQARTADATTPSPLAFGAPGGTLAFVTTPDGAFAVTSIAETDQIHVVRVAAMKLEEDPLDVRAIGDIALAAGDEPGRVAADASGRAHVVLRRAGAVVTVDPVTMTVVDRRAICPSPRGLVFDGARSVIHVACESGEVIALDATSGEETRRTFVSRGLEDVTLLGDGIVARACTELFIVPGNGGITPIETRRIVGAMRPMGTGALLGISSETSFTAINADGNFAPSLAIGNTKVIVTDMAAASDGTVVLAAGGDALLLTSTTSVFSVLPGVGVMGAVALADVTTGETSRRVLALRATTPASLTFLTLADVPEVVALEPLSE
jgi:hypothetical protein